MKRLAIFLVCNLGLNGVLLAASPATSSPTSLVPAKSPAGPIVSSGPVVNQPAVPATVAPVAIKPAPVTQPTAVTVVPAPVQSIPDQMAALQAAAITNMSNLSADGVKALTQHSQTTIDGMNITQKQALASPKIGDLPNLQTYLDQLTNFANTGQKSLANLATEFKNKITTVATNASAAIQALAGSDSTNAIIASTDINSLNTQATNSAGQIDRTSAQAMDQINSLLTTIEATITSAYTAAKDNKTPKMGKDALDSLIGGLAGGIGTAATGLALYYAKQIGCKFGFGTCPPVDAETEAFIKKFKLPSNVDALLEKVGCKNVSELLNRSANTLDELKKEVAAKLGVAQDKVNELITKAGQAAGASEQDITGLLEKLGSIQEAVQKAVPGANIEEIMQKVGAKLSEVTGQDINVSEIVRNVTDALNPSAGAPAAGPEVESGPSSVGPTEPRAAKGSSADTTNYEKLQASSASAKEQLLQQIRSGSMTRESFNTQIEQLRTQMQVATSDQEKANLQEQINAADEIVTEAGNPELDPFEIAL